MPELAPVTGNPFAIRLIPVDHDPFAMQMEPVMGDPFSDLIQHVNDVTNRGGPQPPLASDVGRGFGIGGASGKPVVVPDPANQNLTPREQFIDEYDALVRQRAAKENQADMKAKNKSINRFEETLNKTD